MLGKLMNRIRKIVIRAPKLSFSKKAFKVRKINIRQLLSTPSIKNKFSIVIAVFIISSVLITGIYIYFKGSQVIVDQSKSNMIMLDRSMSDTMNEILTREVLAVTELTHRPVITEYLNASSSMDSEDEVKKNYYIRKISEDFTDYKTKNTYIDDIFVMANNGSVVAGDSDRLVNKNSMEIKQLISENSIVYDPKVSGFIGKQDVVFSAPIQLPDCILGYVVTCINVDKLASYLSAFSINQKAENYAFVVDQNGIVLAHPDKTVLGTAIKNSTLNKSIQAIKNKKEVSPGTLKYTDHGEAYIAAYNVVSKTGWINIINANESDLAAPARGMASAIIFIGLLVTLISVFAGFYVAQQVTNPILKVTKLVNKAAKLDLSDSAEFEYLTKNKDEIGAISVSIFGMINALRDMIIKLSSASNVMAENARFIINTVGETKNKVNATSLDSHEISQGMQEMSASTQEITSVVESLIKGLEVIQDKVHEGTNVSELITEKAGTVRDNSVSAKNAATGIYSEVKSDVQQSVDDTKGAIGQIMSFTEVIKNIASQTKLLSLNASIEAARAGDAGKGFSVVAGEIRTLSEQTTKAVSDISKMVEFVNASSNKLFKSSHKMLDYIDNEVNNDYNGMINISEQYKSDAVTVQEIMNSLNTTIDMFSESLRNISHVISETSVTVNSNAEDITDIAAQAGEINKEVESILEATSNNMNNITDIRELISHFKL